MGTTRITISVPDELADALRQVALATNDSISGVAAGALARRIREAELESLLLDIQSRDTPIPEAALDSARKTIVSTQSRKSEKRRGKVA
jgi:hypothetical protein